MVNVGRRNRIKIKNVLRRKDFICDKIEYYLILTYLLKI